MIFKILAVNWILLLLPPVIQSLVSCNQINSRQWMKFSQETDDFILSLFLKCNLWLTDLCKYFCVFITTPLLYSAILRTLSWSQACLQAIFAVENRFSPVSHSCHEQLCCGIFFCWFDNVALDDDSRIFNIIYYFRNDDDDYDKAISTLLSVGASVLKVVGEKILEYYENNNNKVKYIFIDLIEIISKS